MPLRRGVLRATHSIRSRGALHAQFKAGFSAFCSLSHPPFRAVLMSKDVKSLPGEGIGWGWEGEAGPAAPGRVACSRSFCYVCVA